MKEERYIDKHPAGKDDPAKRAGISIGYPQGLHEKKKENQGQAKD